MNNELKWERIKVKEKNVYRNTCPFCNTTVLSSETRLSDIETGVIKYQICKCLNCCMPVTLGLDKEIIPKSQHLPFQSVKHIPDNINKLYTECRKTYANECFHSCILLARTIIMYIAVDLDAEKGKSFLFYINYLEEEGHIAKNAKKWVDKIREHGNRSVHTLEDITMEDADLVLKFLMHLLINVYELPNYEKIDKNFPQQEKEIVTEETKLLQKNTHEMQSLNQTIKSYSSIQQQIQVGIQGTKTVPKKITVLFLASNPIGTDLLKLDTEARSIQEMIRKSEHRDSLLFKTHWGVRPSDILQGINELNPAIIHFSGHGSEDGNLILENPDGIAKFVVKEAITEAIITSSDDIKLIFFNTCFSAEQASNVVNHINLAIGMVTSIGDEAACIFAAQFYSSIGFGLSVAKAFNQAKSALMLEGIEEENTPKLYAKDGINPDKIFLVSK